VSNMVGLYISTLAAVKGVSDERQNRPTKIRRASCKNRPILSADKTVILSAKIEHVLSVANGNFGYSNVIMHAICAG